MSILSIFNKGNERLARGLCYDNSTLLTTDADNHTLQFTTEYKA